MLETSLDRAIAHWSKRGVCLQPPATEDEILSKFERCGHRPAADVVSLYQRLNGFSSDELRKTSFTLWSLARIIDEHQHYDSEGVWFADFLVCSHCYSLRTENLQTSSVYIEYSDGIGSHKVADSLEEFFHLLLTDPSSIDVIEIGDEEIGGNTQHPWWWRWIWWK